MVVFLGGTNKLQLKNYNNSYLKKKNMKSENLIFINICVCLFENTRKALKINIEIEKREMKTKIRIFRN